jgi:hypothetical protein
MIRYTRMDFKLSLHTFWLFMFTFNVDAQIRNDELKRYTRRVWEMDFKLSLHTFWLFMFPLLMLMPKSHVTSPK